MAVLIQPVIDARASGGGLSENAEGQMLLSATWGLGSAIAQGEVVPDRVVLSRQGFLRSNVAGRKDHRDTCAHGAAVAPQAVPKDLVEKPCLDAGEAVTLGRMLRKVETLFGMPVEIEWALDDEGFKLLQARPLHVEPATVPDDIWLAHPGLRGHPAGIGWGTGRAVVINCECELARVAPGDVLVTRVAGPALSHVLPSVAGVVAELGGSTSHLASLARERGLPMVLGVLDATAKFRTAPRSRSTASPASYVGLRDGGLRDGGSRDGGLRDGGSRDGGSRDGDRVMARVFVTQPVVESALARLRGMADVTLNPDGTRVIAKDQLIAGVRGCDILFSLLHDPVDRDVIVANPRLRAITSMSITPDNIDVAEATARKIPVTVVPALAVEFDRRHPFCAAARSRAPPRRRRPRRARRRLSGLAVEPSARRRGFWQDHRARRRPRPHRPGGGGAGARLFHAHPLLRSATDGGG